MTAVRKRNRTRRSATIAMLPAALVRPVQTTWDSLCAVLLGALLGVQALFIVLYLNEPGNAPPGGGLIEAVWVSSRRHLVYALVSLCLAGPALTMPLVMRRGLIRWLAILCWVVLGTIACTHFPDKLEAVGRVIWRHELKPALRQLP